MNDHQLEKFVMNITFPVYLSLMQIAPPPLASQRNSTEPAPPKPLLTHRHIMRPGQTAAHSGQAANSWHQQGPDSKSLGMWPPTF